MKRMGRGRWRRGEGENSEESGRWGGGDEDGGKMGEGKGRRGLRGGKGRWRG